ncbi:2-methylfumaryl-CoA isomerase [Candidatus Defluviicoccus seviourii]|uniref:2-methylfumaryl-CoA isomerase n=2 Tax=root TaxID=1 RepID=A0A564WAV3_9PROT|nr:2-methylfumaryl-CoA isomerase [uncultured Defluviicoccus sp.]VUX45257.1 2-methylfumaryl-CoA isomerase [Candidatus Defluviicoccus seviourii]
MTGILSGLRIVEGSAFVAMPVGGMTMAQLGADVIRFDPIGGGLDFTRWPVTLDGEHSLFWAGFNKGKRSIAVDFRKPKGQEILTRLITAPGENAGLFVTNFPARGWLDYETLRGHRPDLVMVNLVGRRDGGSEVDYTVNPQTGLPFVTGPTVFPRPVNHLLPAWDCIAGQMAMVGLLAAERHRRLTGEGQLVRLALKDVALAMLGNLGKIAEVMVNDTDRPKDGNYLYGAFGRDFGSLDGKRLMVVGLTHGQWKALVEATGLEQELDLLAARLRLNFKKEGDRFRARREIARVFEPWFATRMLQEIRRTFDQHGVTWAQYRTVRETIEHDRDCSVDNPMFAMVDQPGIGSYLMPGSPLDFAAVARTPVRRAPRLGEHTEEILHDILGLSDTEVGQLYDDGVVAGPGGLS